MKRAAKLCKEIDQKSSRRSGGQQQRRGRRGAGGDTTTTRPPTPPAAALTTTMADLPGVEGGGSADPAPAATAPVAAAAAGPAASPPGSRVAKAAWRATAVVARVEENGEYVELPGTPRRAHTAGNFPASRREAGGRTPQAVRPAATACEDVHEAGPRSPGR